jgi:indolepyruvate ferredoxin oxidoreductase, beta subunit
VSANMTNVLIVGVGGQGVILASNILCEIALRAGLDVKKSEVHGMSQRGGVVSSHIRFGTKVHSPLIAAGTTDALLSFEAAEGLRFAHEVKEGGMMITSTQMIKPPKGKVEKNFTGLGYPNEAIKDAETACKGKVIGIEAEKIAYELGNPNLTNTILLGALSVSLDIEEDIWTNCIKAMVPPKTIELNLQAFARGKEVVSNA